MVGFSNLAGLFMPTKIKMLFVFLAIGAIFSVLSFSDVFRGAHSELIRDLAKPFPLGLEEDADHDGLSNTDESYWNTDFQNPDTDGDGFLDGEETISRHDPTIPGPDDALLDLNITKKMANLAVAGIAEGSLKPGSPDYEESVDDLTLSIIDDGLRSLSPEDPPKITTVDPSKENQQKYVYVTETIWELFLKSFIEEMKNLEPKLELTNNGGFNNDEFIIYFSLKSKEFQDIANQLTKVNVPQNWKDEHVNFYRLISKLLISNKALAEANEDTIKATLAFSLLGNAADEFAPLIKRYTDKIDYLKLSLQVVR